MNRRELLLAGTGAGAALMGPGQAVAGKTRAALAGETLGEGLPRLGKGAGVVLCCGPRAAGRRFYLFVEDRPLAEVLDRLKTSVPHAPGKAAWFKDGSVLVFDEDVASLNARRAAAARRLRELTAERHRRYREMGEWLRPGTADHEGLANKKKKAALYRRVFEGMPAESRNAAFSGRRAEVGYQDLTPQGQAAVRALLGGGARLADQRRIETGPTGTPSVPGMRLVLWGPRDPGGSRGGTGFEDMLNPPEWNPKEGGSYAHLYQSYRERDRGPKHRAMHPDLQEDITLEGSSYHYIEKVLHELHERSGYSVLGEYDPAYSRPWDRHDRLALEAASVRKLPLWKALDVVARRFDLDWTYRDGWINFRSPRTLLEWAGEVDLSPPREG